LCSRGDEPAAFRTAAAGLAVATLREVLGVSGAVAAAVAAPPADVTLEVQ
jgi:hypothetical protein